MNSKSLKNSSPPKRESELSQLLRLFTKARSTGDAAVALRSIDRAWRMASADPEINFLYGRLLLSAGDFLQAEKLLRRAVAGRSYPDYEAAYVSALCAGGQIEAAQHRLERALETFAVVPDGALAQAGQQVVKLLGSQFPGWVAIGPDLNFHGEMIGQADIIKLEIAEDSLAPRAQWVRCALNRPFTSFEIPIDQTRSVKLGVRAHNKVLLGGKQNIPPDFGLDGRIASSRGVISGWVTLKWDPVRPLKLTLSDENGLSIPIDATPDPTHFDRQIFSLAPDVVNGAGNSLTVSAIMPDGSLNELPGSPFLVRLPRPAARALLHSTRRETPNSLPIISPRERTIDIVIPVYSGVEETLTCIRSVIATAKDDAEIIVIDDASPDCDMAPMLAQLAAAGAITLLRNAQNLGFPATANRGLTLHPSRDVVLLNADTEVYGDWVSRLRTAAYSQQRIASVTPLTNSGSIATYPASEDPDLTSQLAAKLDRLAASTNSYVTIDIPTGVGFCLYIRRDCMDEIGYLDGELFSKGYGEENDFCMRAAIAGWKHVLAANIYIRHSGSRSFGGRRAALYERNLRLLNIKHRDYDGKIREYLKRDPAHLVRRRLDEERLIGVGNSYVLLVSLGLDGGVDRAVRERIITLRAMGLKTILLTPDLKNGGRCNLEIEASGYDDLHYDFANEATALKSLLTRLELEHIELHHFLDLPPSLIDYLFDCDCPTDVKIHDYIWYCPRITLLDKAGRYCGEPDLKTCQSCVDANGGRLNDNLTVAKLRARSESWLRAAREITVPSPSVARRMEAQFANLKFRIEPLENDIPSRTHVAAEFEPTKRIKVALIGAIGDHKGYKILLAMAKDAAKRNLPLEFVVIGFTKNDLALEKTGKVFITGRYDEGDVKGLVARELPNLFLFLSVFPESWCYSLTHAMRAGIPIAALDLGAIGDRLRGISGDNLLFPISLSPARICDRLLSAFSPLSSRQLNAINSLPIQNGSSLLPLKPDILSNIPTLPEAAGISRTIMAPPSTAPTASVSLLPLTKGLFLFSVRSTQPSQRVDDHSGIHLPAMQVGTAPGAPSGQIEFMLAPRTHSSWLSEPNDQIVAKISSTSAVVMLTSVMIPGMTPLEIEVKRLDSPELVSSATQKTPTLLSSPPLPTQASIRLEVTPHIQNHGDLAFGESQWAGLVGQGFWIESFSVVPLEQLPPDAIEYMAVTATGVETPWVSGGGACGTRGIGVPLTGFAVRAKPQFQDQVVTCEYGAILLSGAVCGPASNGVLCSGPNASEPIGAIWVSIGQPSGSLKSAVKRRRVIVRPEMIAPPEIPTVESAAKKKRSIGPRFSVFRESGKSE
jgi:GT2 family glycosyltransferase